MKTTFEKLIKFLTEDETFTANSPKDLKKIDIIELHDSEGDDWNDEWNNEEEDDWMVQVHNIPVTPELLFEYYQRKDTEYDIEFGQLEDPNAGWGSFVDEGIFIYLPDGTQWFASTPRMEDDWNTEE